MRRLMTMMAAVAVLAIGNVAHAQNQADADAAIDFAESASERAHDDYLNQVTWYDTLDQAFLSAGEEYYEKLPLMTQADADYGYMLLVMGDALLTLSWSQLEDADGQLIAADSRIQFAWVYYVLQLWATSISWAESAETWANLAADNITDANANLAVVLSVIGNLNSINQSY